MGILKPADRLHGLCAVEVCHVYSAEEAEKSEVGPFPSFTTDDAQAFDMFGVHTNEMEIFE